jgi:hypothetical protein
VPPPGYSGDEALIVIETGEVFAGSLPGRALRLVRAWLDEQRAELMANWIVRALANRLNLWIR